MTRYVVSARTPDDQIALPEDEQYTLVAPLDRGVILDADPRAAAQLTQAGLRVKELPDPHTIHFWSYRIDTQHDTPTDIPTELTTTRPDQESEDEGDVNHIVQFVGPAQESWLAMLAERGVQVVEPVGPFAFFIRADATTVTALQALPFVAWTGRLEPAYKVNPVLLTDELSYATAGDDDATDGDQPDQIEALDIGVLADSDTTAVVDAIERAGGTVLAVASQTRDTYRSITAQLPAAGLPAVAARSDVRWIDAVYRPVPEDERAAQIVYEDLDAAAPPNTAPVPGYAANLADLGVDGSTVTIAIRDTGIDTNDPATVHADLAGRLAFAVTGEGDALAAGRTDTGRDSHGTHVAGIAAGNGATGNTDPDGFVLGMGAAPGAQVGSLVPPGSWAQHAATAVRQGAEVMNLSLRVNPAGSAYSASDRALDLAVRDADTMAAGLSPLVLVFSAGNDGSDGCTKAVKNALVVGNSLNWRPGEGDLDDIRGLAADSSRGPAADGRLLPTLVAPGTNIVSARSSTPFMSTAYRDRDLNIHPNHTRNSGTSMAAPRVAGTCALLIDWWRQTREGATPSPALIKAWLVVSTESVEGGPDRNGGTIDAGPTNDAGWGRVSIENTLLQGPASDRGPKLFSDQRHAFTATGQEYRIRVAAADPTRPLRIALAWTDAPGTPGASPALVNDLDLEVTDDSGDIFLGNQFVDGFSTAGGAADNLNNLECVAVQNPSGVYEVSVVAANMSASARPDLATPWQDFALVIDNGEVPAADPVSVVAVLDRSGSMQSSGYVEVTRQTSRQFIDQMSPDDSVGVVSFGTSATQEYPPSGGPALITGPAVRDAAKGAVDGIGFGGCTFMGEGIATAGGMLADAGSRRAMVLLSDGYDNKGCDPGNPAKPSALQAAAALPTGLPIYSCAMGPASDQPLLAQLADDTDGRYYFMPTIDDLFEIYNYIRGQVTGEGIIVNESSMASRSTVAGIVDACADTVLFTVAWHDESLRYVAAEPRRSDEISVRLRSPGGRWLPHSATEIHRTVGVGYVGLQLQDPEPGLWTVEVSTSRDRHTPYTVGGFVRSDIMLDVDMPSQVKPGQPIDVRALARIRDDVIDGAKIAATVTAPCQRIETLLKMYAGRLDRIQMPDGYHTDGEPDTHQMALTKLVLLRDQIRAATGEDIMAPVTSSVPMSAAASRVPALLASPLRGSTPRPTPPQVSARSTPVLDGGVARTRALLPSGLATARDLAGSVFDWRKVARPREPGLCIGRVDRTTIAGSYTVRVVARGYSDECRSPFVRLTLASAAVAHPVDQHRPVVSPTAPPLSRRPVGHVTSPA